jgi:hypothetical protein
MRNPSKKREFFLTNLALRRIYEGIPKAHDTAHIKKDPNLS